ncbi:MAG: lacI [Microbacteriaceae bacterium]|nr:lacI [Microbacteriaceae bacterium]
MVDSSHSVSPATLHDVARVAGVSLATASRSLNGSTRKVNEEYRQRVLAAAAALSYSPNLSAQAVAKGGSDTIALIVGDIADPYFSSIAAGVLRRADETGLIVTIGVSGRSASRELELVRAMRGYRPRAILLAGSRFRGDESSNALTAELSSFEATGGRVVVMSQAELPFDTVVVENYEGGRGLARALVERGYQRFGAITGGATLLTSSDRFKGFTDGLAEQGIAMGAQNVEETLFTRDGGHEAARRLIADHRIDDIEIIFATNDVMAVGAMSALRQAGVRVPEDVAIAGYGDIATARDVTPALTTVRVPIEEVGERAIALVLAEKGSVSGDSVPTSVVLRASTPGPHGPV